MSMNKNFTDTTDRSCSSQRKILPSTEDIYIRLTGEELDLIERCRFAQGEEDEKQLASYDDEFTSSTTSEETTEKTDEFDSAFSSGYNSTVTESINEIPAFPVKRRIIHPEVKLSNPHHIPSHITVYEESLTKSLSQQELQEDKS